MNRPEDNSPTDLLSKDSRAKVAGDPGYMDKLIHVGTEMTDLLGKNSRTKVANTSPAEMY